MHQRSAVFGPLVALLSFCIGACGPKTSERPVETAEARESCAYGDFGKCDERCAAGDIDACAASGAMLAVGDRVGLDLERGVARLKQACEAGALKACTAIAFIAEDSGDGEGARALLGGSCAGGELAACRALDSAQAKIDIAPAQRLTLEQVCVNVSAVVPLCTGGDGQACATVAMCAYRDANWTAAVKAARTSCDLNYGGGCRILAELTIQGQGTAMDPKAAVALLRKACKLQDLNSCDLLRSLGETE
jgi:TPR repeat protein